MSANKSARSRDNFRKDARFPHTVNSRKSGVNGQAMPTVASLNSDYSVKVHKRISAESVPMNFLPVAVGACAVRKVIFRGNETIVLFDGGEKVSVVCSEGDKYDKATAVAWALLKFSFGKNFNRQIHKIIETVGIDADALHSEKTGNANVAKASRKAKSSSKKRSR